MFRLARECSGRAKFSFAAAAFRPAILERRRDVQKKLLHRLTVKDMEEII